MLAAGLDLVDHYKPGLEPSRPSPDKVKGPVLRQALLLYLAVREG